MRCSISRGSTLAELIRGEQEAGVRLDEDDASNAGVARQEPRPAGNADGHQGAWRGGGRAWLGGSLALPRGLVLPRSPNRIQGAALRMIIGALPGWGFRRRRRWIMRIGWGLCTATSSRPICWLTLTTTFGSRTSGWPGFLNDSGLTLTGNLLGTLRYMSPEQAMAKRAIVDERTDIYSLGATLYELLTLKPAVPGGDRLEVLRRIAQDEPVAPRRIDRWAPRDLETIVLKTMAKEPEARYATAADLAGDLRRFLEHRPIKARRPSAVERTAKWRGGIRRWLFRRCRCCSWRCSGFRLRFTR